MSKRRVPSGSIPKEFRVTRGGTSARDAVVSVAWKYEHERGQTVWLRPASGIDIGAHPRAGLR